MKKLILTLTLAATIASAYGQGSVAFSNGTLSRHSIQQGWPPSQVPVPTTPGLLKYGLWYGVGSASAVNSNAAPWIIGVNSTTGPGLIASSADGKTPLSNVPLGPETFPGESDIWVQVIAWDARYDDWQSAKTNPDPFGVLFGTMTDVVNINALGSPAIAGTSIWQSYTGTNPKLLNPLQMIAVIPEPTTMALAGLGAVALLAARRRR
jgi:hypothetical protein